MRRSLCCGPVDLLADEPKGHSLRQVSEVAAFAAAGATFLRITGGFVWPKTLPSFTTAAGNFEIVRSGRVEIVAARERRRARQAFRRKRAGCLLRRLAILQPFGRSLKNSLGLACLSMVGGLLCGLLWACNKPAALPPKAERVPTLNEVKAKAESGDATAQNMLGEMYVKGQGAAPNYKEAANWFRKAAEQGNPAGQSNLGMMYEAGQGVPLDYAEAVKWYRRAAERGYSDAQYNLAVMYTFARGVPNDIAEAVKWFRLAAEQGDGLAQYNIGQRYRIAKGLPQDLVEAYKWLSLAAAQGTPDAAKDRDALKRSMTREQVSEAQRRVREFIPKNSAPAATK